MQAGGSNYTVGIDVSHYQGEVNWPAVAGAGVRFAFIKATDGIQDIDPRFAQNWPAPRPPGSSGALIISSARPSMRSARPRIS